VTAFIHIGTSGWHYDHWKGRYYPEDLSTSDQLAHYADEFDSVEINNSFYQMPSENTLRTWKETVPEGFRFSVKASRYITHMKKLKDPEEPVANFYERMEGFLDRVGAVLFQLPPNFGCNPERLTAFLEALPDEGPVPVFEFRDPELVHGGGVRPVARAQGGVLHL